MERPSSSKSVQPNDPSFNDRILRLLSGENADESDDDSVVDDSDNDPDFIIRESDGDSTSCSSDDDDEFLEDQGEATNIINAVAVNVPMPPFFIERQRKTESGPPNAWKSDPPPRNVRAPARNIIRTGLPGIAGPARALGNKPTKVEVWRLFLTQI